MKVVAKTDKGYLVQISYEELGVITGFGKYPAYGSDEKKAKFCKAVGIKDSHSTIPTDTVIEVISGVDYIARIRNKATTVKKTANELRELADLLDKSIPDILIPPAEEPNA